VIIGINSYKDSPLEGAKSDALNFYSLLTSGWRVPKDNVRLLLDGCAARHSIIDALSELRCRPISQGDTIIVYYAGHGSSYRTADVWPGSRNLIEAIVPVDRGGSGREQVPDISDREISLFLEDLAFKSNNITVILDCCFAGGITRADMTAGDASRVSGLRRTSPLPNSLRSMLEAAAMRYHKSIDKFQPGQWVPSRTSHVVLAACQEFQGANEDSVGGRFTSALLNVLKTEPLNSVSYGQLITMMIGPLGHEQLPVVAGEHKGSNVFRILPSIIRGEGETPTESISVRINYLCYSV
jgi:Caspase domain